MTAIGSPSRSSRTSTEKGLYELGIFLAALATGTTCSIASKILYDTRDATNGRHFDKPLAQTLAMFVAMIVGLPLHWLIAYYQVPFPGYERFVTDNNNKKASSSPSSPKHVAAGDIDRTPRMRGISARRAEREALVLAAADTNDKEYDEDNNRLPLRIYFYLIVPAIFDCIATALSMVGLLFLDVSIYQLLRGSGIIFVALLRQHLLHEELYRFQWLGVAWNAVSVLLVGATALLESSSPDSHKDSGLESASIGVAFMLAGTMVQGAFSFCCYCTDIEISDESVSPPWESPLSCSPYVCVRREADGAR